MQRFALAAECRQTAGKGAARKIRAQGKIPAILYGEKKDPLPLAVSRRDLSMLLQSHEGVHLLVDLSVEGARGEKTLAVVHDLDIDPVNRVLLHADFLRVDPNKPIRTTIPLHLTGLPVGVREGGVHQHVLRELEVEALPTDMPEFIEHDIATLRMGDSLHVSDLIKEGTPYAIITEAQRVISTILAPRLVEVEAAEAPVEGAPEAEGAKETDKEAKE